MVRPSHHLPHEEGELVGVLAGRWHAHRARPVVVQVAHLVREALHVVRDGARAVVHYDVVGGCHRSLAHFLRHQEEVVPAMGGVKFKWI